MQCWKEYLLTPFFFFFFFLLSTRPLSPRSLSRSILLRSPLTYSLYSFRNFFFFPFSPMLFLLSSVSLFTS